HQQRKSHLLFLNRTYLVQQVRQPHHQTRLIQTYREILITFLPKRSFSSFSLSFLSQSYKYSFKYKPNKSDTYTTICLTNQLNSLRMNIGKCYDSIIDKKPQKFLVTSGTFVVLHVSSQNLAH